MVLLQMTHHFFFANYSLFQFLFCLVVMLDSILQWLLHFYVEFLETTEPKPVIFNQTSESKNYLYSEMILSCL